MTVDVDIDGWKVRLAEPNGFRKNYHVEANDILWGKFAECWGRTAIDAIDGLADRTGLDREELRETFGL